MSELFPKGYPEEWLRAAVRANAAIDDSVGSEREHAHLILDHLAPVIQRTTVEQANAALSLAGVKRQLRHEITGALTVDAQQPSELIDVRLTASNDGSVPGANLTAVDVTEEIQITPTGIVHLEIDRLLEQLIERFDKVLETTHNVGIVAAAGLIGGILEDVRQERRDT